jgi:hypothetical protein
MKTEVTYRWRIKWCGRWTNTNHDATEEQIRKEHPEAIPLEWSRKEKLVPETDEERRAARLGPEPADPDYGGKQAWAMKPGEYQANKARRLRGGGE